MVDPQGDHGDHRRRRRRLRETLEDWIPKILAGAASRRLPADGVHAARHGARVWRPRPPRAHRGPPAGRRRRAANHEGYVAGYFIESAINHYVMTEGKDLRLYDAAKKLADCWADTHRSRAEAGVVRRAPGNGAGARAVRPLRERGRGAGRPATGPATGTSRSRSSCSTAARAARSTTRATCRCSSSTRPSATPCAPSTPTRAWRTSPSRRTTSTTRAP